MDETITTRGLRKNYKKIKALDDVSIRILEGEIHGLFGPNGAGKSTLIRVISGITRPDSGSARIKDLDVLKYPTRAREYCTIIVEIPKLYAHMKLYDLLMYFCSVNGMGKEEAEERILEAVDVCSIGDILRKKFANMSLGQQHRVEVARAIATSRDIILMDEPFIGIDIDTKRRLKEYFRNWVRKEKGRSILFTSHNLLENEGFVNRISFIFNGGIRDTGSVSDIKAKYLKAGFTLEVDNPKRAVEIISGLEGVEVDKVEEGRVYVLMEDEKLMKEVNQNLLGADVMITQLSRTGSMEDVFSQLVEVSE